MPGCSYSIKGSTLDTVCQTWYVTKVMVETAHERQSTWRVTVAGINDVSGGSTACAADWNHVGGDAAHGHAADGPERHGPVSQDATHVSLHAVPASCMRSSPHYCHSA